MVLICSVISPVRASSGWVDWFCIIHLIVCSALPEEKKGAGRAIALPKPFTIAFHIHGMFSSSSGFPSRAAAFPFQKKQ
jgi:hypothetical protein